MIIKSTDTGFVHPVPSEITPEAVYQQRREWLRVMAGGVAGAAMASWASRSALAQMPVGAGTGKPAPLPGTRSGVPGAMTIEKVTDYRDATSYNNFYEFGTGKSDPARYAPAMKTTPWTVEVEGAVRKPAKYTLEDLLKLSALEERIYRLRCVEGWSMVIPWVGYSLNDLIQRVEPLGNARFVEFVTVADSGAMPALAARILPWPYTEALRLDEAMNPLTMLVFGMYGEILPNQNGAPVRLVIPWKYGYKSAKSLVKIRFTERQPSTSWNRVAAPEYGFYGNVNPNVDHPRWSQSSERRIGEDGLFARKRKTLMFNGYEAQVGQLYAGMDLEKHY